MTNSKNKHTTIPRLQALPYSQVKLFWNLSQKQPANAAHLNHKYIKLGQNGGQQNPQTLIKTQKNLITYTQSPDRS